MNAGVLLVLGLVAALAHGAAWEWRRRRLKRQRFVDRERLGFDAMFDRYYSTSGLSRDVVRRHWNRVASLLRMDGERLRPFDRLDVELAPLAGAEMSDEIEDLMEHLQAAGRGQPQGRMGKPLETLDDVIRYLSQEDEHRGT